MTDKKISQLTGATTPLAGTEEVPLVQSGTTKKVTVANLTAGRSVSTGTLNVSSGTLNSDVAEFTGNNAGRGLKISTFNSGNSDGGVTLNAQTSALAVLALATGGTERARFNASGDFIFNENGNDSDFRVESDTNANMLVMDAGVSKVGIGTNTFNTNGAVLQVSNGISFPATQSACSDVNTLDDYEEGVWTPVYTPETGAYTTLGAVNSGIYVKIGNVVHIWGNMRTTGTPDLGTAGGRFFIGGLPFPCGATGVGNGAVTLMQKLNLGTAFAYLGVQIDGTASSAYLCKNASNSGITYVQATELSTATDNFGNLMSFFAVYTV